jgi:hypothetical protein
MTRYYVFTSITKSNSTQILVPNNQLTKMNCKVLNRGWDHGSLQLKEGWTTHIEPFEFEKKKFSLSKDVVDLVV